MLPVFLIIAIFTMVWTVGRGIADEKNRPGTRIAAIRCQAVVRHRSHLLPSGGQRRESSFHRLATGGYVRAKTKQL